MLLLFIFCYYVIYAAIFTLTLCFLCEHQKNGGDIKALEKGSLRNDNLDVKLNLVFQIQLRS